MEQEKTETELGSAAETRTPLSYADLGVGSRVDRYVIVKELGEGGMAKVFSGYDTKLGRIVALKVLRSETNTAQIRARLLREAQAMARLAHPNVVAVYDVGTFGENVFIAMEYIEGTTLRQWLKETRSWKETLAVMKAAGRGLAAAHSAGLVHRDFKPDNVLVGKNGRVVVSDFGIVRAEDKVYLPTIAEEAESLEAKIAAEPSIEQLQSAGTGDLVSPMHSALESHLTELGSILGTTGYISPERALEQRDDARSDQFSFCVTLYLALYGRHPYIYRNLETYLDALSREPEPPPRETAVPGWIYEILQRGLQRNPGARFRSMDDLILVLERDPWRLRRYVILGISACVVCLGIGFGYARHFHVLKEQCLLGERITEATWNPKKQDQVSQAIEKTRVPEAADIARRTVGALNAYTADWAKAYRQVSEAALLKKKQSKKEMEQRLSCLNRAHEELDALVNVLLKADATTAKNALPAVYRLLMPRRCVEDDAARIAVGLPDEPEARRKLIAVHRALAEAEALSFAGKPDQALAILNHSLDVVRQIHHHRAEAELLLSMGNCLDSLADVSSAISTRQKAFDAALASGSDALAASAKEALLRLNGNKQDMTAIKTWLESVDSDGTRAD